MVVIYTIKKRISLLFGNYHIYTQQSACCYCGATNKHLVVATISSSSNVRNDIRPHSSLSMWGKQHCRFNSRSWGGWSLTVPKKSSSSLSFSALTYSKVSPLASKVAMYLFAVLRDTPVWAANESLLRPWLYILRICLILLMLIVELAMLHAIGSRQKLG